jgi:hypothetical protein
MALVQRLVTFTSSLNGGLGEVVAQADLYLAMRRGYVQDMALDSLRRSTSRGRVQMRLLFLEAIDAGGGEPPAMGLRLTASLWQTSTTVSGLTATTQITAAYQAGRARVPIVWFDATSSLTGDAVPQSIVLIEAQTDVADGYGLGLLGHPEVAHVAEASALIPAGGVGLADVYDAAGALVLAGAQVTNVHPATDIPLGSRVYCIVSPDTGVLIALPCACVPGAAPVIDPRPVPPPPVNCPDVEVVSITPIVPPVIP